MSISQLICVKIDSPSVHAYRFNLTINKKVKNHIKYWNIRFCSNRYLFSFSDKLLSIVNFDIDSSTKVASVFVSSPFSPTSPLFAANAVLYGGLIGFCVGSRYLYSFPSSS